MLTPGTPGGPLSNYSLSPGTHGTRFALLDGIRSDIERLGARLEVPVVPAELTKAIPYLPTLYPNLV
jgi:hypothetical protein